MRQSKSLPLTAIRTSSASAKPPRILRFGVFVEYNNKNPSLALLEFMSMDVKPEILTSPSFFLKTPMSDIEQRRRLRARVEAMTPEQQKALLTILTQSRETEKSTSD